MPTTALKLREVRDPRLLQERLADHDDRLDDLEDGGILLDDDSVTTAKLDDDAVTNDKLADDAVDSAQIADGAVDLAHMSANSVDSDQYVDGSIDTAHIGDVQVTSAKIATGAVGTDQMADAGVTVAKMAATMQGSGTVQALSGAGAVNLTTAVTRYTSTGGSQALTLADGSVNGHRKRIIHVVDGGSGVLTAGGSLHLGNSIATITFTNVFDWVELEWQTNAWFVVAYSGVSIS